MVDYRGKTVEGLLTWADDTLSFEAPDDESGFWREAARIVFKNDEIVVYDDGAMCLRYLVQVL